MAKTWEQMSAFERKSAGLPTTQSDYNLQEAAKKASGISNPVKPSNVTSNAPQQANYLNQPMTYSDMANGQGTNPNTTNLNGTVFQKPMDGGNGLPPARLNEPNISSLVQNPNASPYSDPNAYANALREKAISDAEAERLARVAAAKQLYDSSVSGFNGEASQLDPIYNDQLTAIANGEYKGRALAAEISNFDGLANSGYEAGAQQSVVNDAIKDRNKAGSNKALALSDIERRKALALQLMNSSAADADAWKATQVRSADYNSFIQGKQAYDTKWAQDNQNKYADANLKLQQRTADLADNNFALNKGNIEFSQGLQLKDSARADTTLEMAKRKEMGDTTGLIQVGDSMIGSNDPLRGVTDYAALIKNIQSNPNWKDDSSSRYLVAAANSLRNQKIEGDPTLKSQYGNTENIQDTYIPTMAGQTNALNNLLMNVDAKTKQLILSQMPEEYRQKFAQTEAQTKQIGAQTNQIGAQTNQVNMETSLLPFNSQTSRIGANASATGAAAAYMNAGTNAGELDFKKDPNSPYYQGQVADNNYKIASTNKLNGEGNSNVVSSAMQDFTNSGKTFDQWLNTADKGGVTYGQILKDSELKSLIDNLKTSGKFSKQEIDPYAPLP